MLLEKNSRFVLASILSKVSSSIIGVEIISPKPSMQELKLDEWHEYRVEWVKQGVNFYVDSREVAKPRFHLKRKGLVQTSGLTMLSTRLGKATRQGSTGMRRRRTGRKPS
jgi:hypothetical protein